MKAVKKFVLFLSLGVAVVATSCKKDTTPGIPNVSAIADKTTAAPGDVVNIAINATADASRTLKDVKVEEITSGTSGAVVVKDSNNLSKNNIGFTYQYTVPSGATGTKQLKVTATDNAGDANSATVSITISGTGGGINTYSTVILPAPLADKSSKSFFSSQNGNTYSKADADNSTSVQGMIDFGYYYTSYAAIAAPSNYNSAVYDLSNWSTRNATKFSTTSMSSSDFDAVTNDAAIITAATGASLTEVKNLAVGQVFAFVTAAGKKGLVRVSDLKPGYASNDYIKIDVKVQK